MKLLLVEDESGLVLTLTDRLKSEGHEVVSKTDGIEGLEAARSDEFDLIVLDVMLPKKSGYDICRDLRQSEPDAEIAQSLAGPLGADRAGFLILCHANSFRRQKPARPNPRSECCSRGAPAD